MRDMPVSLFALNPCSSFGQQVADHLQIPLRAHEEREFDYGEHKIRSLESVRNRSVYVLHTLCGDHAQSANDRLCRLLFFIAALKDAGAASVTACLTYLAYARKDRRTKSRDPVTNRYVAMLFEAMGMDRVMALEVHNAAAFDNAFRCEAAHLTAAKLFAEHFSTQLPADRCDCSVVSPDVGGIKRAQQLRDLLHKIQPGEVTTAFMDKQRSADVISGEALVGDVEGRQVLIYDDLISSGTTVVRAVHACRRAGAKTVHVAATHAVFSEAARQLFESGIADSVIVTDSVPLHPAFHVYRTRGLTVLGTASLFAEAIHRMETGGSLSELRGNA